MAVTKNPVKLTVFFILTRTVVLDTIISWVFFHAGANDQCPMEYDLAIPILSHFLLVIFLHTIKHKMEEVA